MLTVSLYPGWELLPTDWRHDIAIALVEVRTGMDGEKTEDPISGNPKVTSYSSLREGETNDRSDSARSLLSTTVTQNHTGRGIYC